jgi:hypothetical protein
MLLASFLLYTTDLSPDKQLDKLLIGICLHIKQRISIFVKKYKDINH